MVRVVAYIQDQFVSQYPPPYQQPTYPNQGPFDFYRPAANPLGPARRASVLMFVLGGLGLMCGAFITFRGIIATPEMIAQGMNSDQLHVIDSTWGRNALRGITIAMGVFCLLPSILYAIMGYWVRSGKMASVVLSIVLTGFTSLLVLLGLLSVVVAGGGDPAALLGAFCMMGIPLVLCIMLLVWLIQAMRAAPAVAAQQQQFQAQYWQSMQQQQAAQLGYGYGMPPGYGYGAPSLAQPPAPPGQAPVNYPAPLMPPPPPPAPPGATGYPNGPDEDPRH